MTDTHTHTSNIICILCRFNLKELPVVEKLFENEKFLHFAKSVCPKEKQVLDWLHNDACELECLVKFSANLAQATTIVLDFLASAVRFWFPDEFGGDCGFGIRLLGLKPPTSLVHTEFHFWGVSSCLLFFISCSRTPSSSTSSCRCRAKPWPYIWMLPTSWVPHVFRCLSGCCLDGLGNGISSSMMSRWVCKSLNDLGRFTQWKAHFVLVIWLTDGYFISFRFRRSPAELADKVSCDGLQWPLPRALCRSGAGMELQ